MENVDRFETLRFVQGETKRLMTMTERLAREKSRLQLWWGLVMVGLPLALLYSVLNTLLGDLNEKLGHKLTVMYYTASAFILIGMPVYLYLVRRVDFRRRSFEVLESLHTLDIARQRILSLEDKSQAMPIELDTDRLLARAAVAIQYAQAVLARRPGLGIIHNYDSKLSSWQEIKASFSSSQPQTFSPDAKGDNTGKDIDNLGFENQPTHIFGQ